MALAAGMAPVKIQACAKSVTFLGMANAYAGGVFLAISLMHILPEAIEAYEKWQHEEEEATGIKHEHKGWETLPYFLFFMGYFVILMVDKVIFDTHTMEHSHDPVNQEFARKARKSFTRGEE